MTFVHSPLFYIWPCHFPWLSSSASRDKNTSDRDLLLKGQPHGPPPASLKGTRTPQEEQAVQAQELQPVVPCWEPGVAQCWACLVSPIYSPGRKARLRQVARGTQRPRNRKVPSGGNTSSHCTPFTLCSPRFRTSSPLWVGSALTHKHLSAYCQTLSQWHLPEPLEQPSLWRLEKAGLEG